MSAKRMRLYRRGGSALSARRAVRSRKRFARRKQYRRRAVTRYRRSAVIGKGFPDKMLVTHKFSRTLGFTLNASDISDYDIKYSCNNLTRPSDSSPDARPIYFDQMSHVYNRYTVIGSRIKITLVRANNINPAITWGMIVDDDGDNTLQNASSYSENNKGFMKVTPANYESPIYFTSKWSAKRAFGSGSIVGSMEISGSSDYAPTNEKFYVLNYRRASGEMASVAASFTGKVEIEYIVVWTDLKEQLRNSD